MTEATTSTESPLFSAVEIEQFDADDVVAGSAIGKMLTVLFCYTVLAMAFVSWWTYSSISGNHGAEAQTSEHAAEH